MSHASFSSVTSPFTASDADLEAHLRAGGSGSRRSTSVRCSADTGRPRGFAFIEMASDSDGAGGQITAS
jgi:hypothetical protein